MKGLIWKQLSLRIKASGKSLHSVVCLLLHDTGFVLVFTWSVWQLSPSKGSFWQNSLSHWWHPLPPCLPSLVSEGHILETWGQAGWGHGSKQENRKTVPSFMHGTACPLPREQIWGCYLICHVAIKRSAIGSQLASGSGETSRMQIRLRTLDPLIWRSRDAFCRLGLASFIILFLFLQGHD
jgi:hypothetical protein